MTATLPTSSTTSTLLSDHTISGETTGEITEKIAEIEAYLDAYNQVHRFSGNVIISYGEEPAVIRSYGMANRTHAIANAPHTKFRIGSITKQFTAAAILQLQDQGHLDVHAPIATYLSDYPNGETITVHHLLTHTAGIPEYLDPKLFPDLAEWMRLPATVEQVVSRFKDLPLEFEPGEKFKYSNSGYILLTQIIEIVSQQTYTDYMQTHFFAPLGMENTGYEVPQAVIPHLAQGYLFVGDDTYMQSAPMDMSLPQGAGGLYSTVADLALWQQSILGNNPEQQVLSDSSVTLLSTSVVKMDGPGDALDAFYGYGLVHDSHLGRQRICHDGGIPGFRSMLAYYPGNSLTISLLTNLDNTPPNKAAADLAAIILGEPYELPVELEVVEIDPARYEKYVGTYQLLPELCLEIRIEGEQLMGQATGQGAFALYPSSETDFFAKIVDLTLTFAVTDEANISGLTLRQLGQELFAPKIDSET